MPKDAKITQDVLFVIYDDVQLLDFAGPWQTFATAQERRAALEAPATGGDVDYRLKLVSSGGGKVRTSSGVGLDTQPLPGRVRPQTTIIVAGGNGVEAAIRDDRLMAWLKRCGSRVRRICSVCTGAFILAEAGLLDGVAATTHWADCETFKRQYPAVDVQPDAIYTRHGGVWTSAGITAGIDLALALIEEDSSASLANATAQWLVVYAKRPGGQSQFSDVLELSARDPDGIFATLHEWMNANLSKPLPLPVLAERAGMSERTLSRRYKAALGMSPARAVRLLRAQRARTLLASSQSSLKIIARRSGFGSVEHMNTALLQFYGATARLLRETSRQDHEPWRRGSPA